MSVSATASTGSGNVANEVVALYNGFGQMIEANQSHTGAVNLSITPSVQMAYASLAKSYFEQLRGILLGWRSC